MLLCLIWAQDVLNGEAVRQVLDLTDWEAANKLTLRSVWAFKRPAIAGADCEARQLKPQSMQKYREIKKELTLFTWME